MICQVCNKQIDKKIRRNKGTFCSEQCFIVGNVEQNNDCWIWKRAKDGGGYGNMGCDSKWKRTHRYVYELYYGAIPEERMILHSCHNRSCVNPNHLRAGTHIENMQDMIQASRSGWGERSGKTDFREIDVETVFYLRKKGYKQREIASIFDVSQPAVSRILAGKRWKYFNQRKEHGV